MEKTQAIQLNIEGEKQDYKTDTNDFKTQHIATVTKTVQYGKRKNGSIEQRAQNRPHKQNQLIVGRSNIIEKYSLFDKSYWGSEHPYARKKNLDTVFFTKIDSKQS